MKNNNVKHATQSEREEAIYKIFEWLAIIAGFLFSCYLFYEAFKTT